MAAGAGAVRHSPDGASNGHPYCLSPFWSSVLRVQCCLNPQRYLLSRCWFNVCVEKAGMLGIRTFWLRKLRLLSLIYISHYNSPLHIMSNVILNKFSFFRITFIFIVVFDSFRLILFIKNHTDSIYTLYLLFFVDASIPLMHDSAFRLSFCNAFDSMIAARTQFPTFLLSKLCQTAGHVVY